MWIDNEKKVVSYRAAFRLFIIAAIVASLLPPPILVTTDGPQIVHTTRPTLGVHTRLTDEVEPWKIKRTLEMVRAMGANWIVEFFPWAYYHAADGDFSWEHPDLVITHAADQGLSIIARLGLTPAWARPPDTTLTYLDATAYDDFADYAVAFVQRYGKSVRHIIIGNEPNLSYEWGYQQARAQDYVNLLKTVYPAVKAVDPDVQVLAGALAATLEPEGSPWGLNDLHYLRAFYGAGAADYFDGLAVHVYGLTFSANAEPNEQLLNFRRVELVRQVMEEYGDTDKFIYITETGWNDHPRWSLAVQPAQRIRYTLDALELSEAEWPYVKMIAFWAFRYPAPTRNYSDYFTLVTPEFVPKPIYNALKAASGN